MNCNEAREHWDLYHDSEGDPALHLAINEHLAVCPDCAQWFSQQSRLEGLLADKLRAQAPTPELWDRVLTRCGLRPPAPAQRWPWLALAACAAAAALVLLGARLLGPRRTEPDLPRLAAAWHDRLAAGEEAVQFAHRSDRAVEDYLRRRVSFPVRCPPRKDAGFAVQGAGVGTLAGKPAAYLAGQVDADPVSIFILPREGVNAVRPDGTLRRREGRYEVVARVIDRNAVVVIGQARPERLERVLNAYGTYPDEH